MLTAGLISSSYDRYQFTAQGQGIQNVVPSLELRRDPEIRKLEERYLFFVGRSADFRIWMLWAIDRDDASDFMEPEDLIAWLSDPPCKNLQAITDGLVSLFLKSRQQWEVTDSDIQAIIEQLDFSVPTVQEILPGAPARWNPLPARFHVHFKLSENYGVDREMFLQWQRHDAESILVTLIEGRRDSILLIYELLTENVLSMERYEVDWPLQRRGKTPPQQKSKDDQQRLCRIYQHVDRQVGFGGTIPVFDPAVIRLAVSGRTPDDAIANWKSIARPLRKLLHGHRSEQAQVKQEINKMPQKDVNALETEEDDREVGQLRLARWRHQNAQLLGKKPRSTPGDDRNG